MISYPAVNSALKNRLQRGLELCTRPKRSRKVQQCRLTRRPGFHGCFSRYRIARFNCFAYAEHFARDDSIIFPGMLSEMRQ